LEIFPGVSANQRACQDLVALMSGSWIIISIKIGWLDLILKKKLGGKQKSEKSCDKPKKLGDKPKKLTSLPFPFKI
jgi:hypothetical protein